MRSRERIIDRKSDEYDIRRAMKLSKPVETVTAVETRPSELIRRAAETGLPIRITRHGTAVAVLQDIDGSERQRSASFSALGGG
jgi:prevent-host-death family protein